MTEQVVILYKSGLSVEQIRIQLRIGKSKAYKILKDSGIELRFNARYQNGGSKPGAGRPTSEVLRANERRDCVKYWDCLDYAAKRDIKAVPCVRCGDFRGRGTE